jgi:hypothetical protein
MPEPEHTLEFPLSAGEADDRRDTMPGKEVAPLWGRQSMRCSDRSVLAL